MRRFCLSIILCSAVLAGCGDGGRAAIIKDRLKSLNYCTIYDDCTVIEGKCPFDCRIPINKDNREFAEHLLETYKSTCTYSCTEQPPVECDNGVCVFSKE